MCVYVCVYIYDAGHLRPSSPCSLSITRKQIHIIEMTLPFETNIDKDHFFKTYEYATPIYDINNNEYNYN